MIKKTRIRPNYNHKAPQMSSSSLATGGVDDQYKIKLKNKNYYQQMYDKYSHLARETLRSGDRVEAEVHFQQAEHYLRQLHEIMAYDQELQQRQQLAHQERQKQRQKMVASEEVLSQNVKTGSSSYKEFEEPLLSNLEKSDLSSQINADKITEDHKAQENEKQGLNKRRNTRGLYNHKRQNRDVTGQDGSEKTKAASHTTKDHALSSNSSDHSTPS